MTEAALLGRLEKFLDVERRLLRDERGRDERCVRLGVLLDADFVGQRLDVCPVLNDADESESESEDGNVVVVVELHLMGEDGLELVERLELVAVQELEDDSCCALGSCPRKPACWILPCSSSAASSPLH